MYIISLTDSKEISSTCYSASTAPISLGNVAIDRGNQNLRFPSSSMCLTFSSSHKEQKIFLESMGNPRFPRCVLKLDIFKHVYVCVVKVTLLK